MHRCRPEKARTVKCHKVIPLLRCYAAGGNFCRNQFIFFSLNVGTIIRTLGEFEENLQNSFRGNCNVMKK